MLLAKVSSGSGPIRVVAAVAAVVVLGCDSQTDAPETSRAEAPPIRTVESLFSREIPGTLGLPKIAGEHALLYQATEEDYKFCHHPNLVVYKNRLHAMWSNGLVGEDENGQRILACHSRGWSQLVRAQGSDRRP